MLLHVNKMCVCIKTIVYVWHNNFHTHILMSSCLLSFLHFSINLKYHLKQDYLNP